MSKSHIIVYFEKSVIWVVVGAEKYNAYEILSAENKGLRTIMW